MTTPEAAPTPEDEKPDSLIIARQLYQSMDRRAVPLTKPEIKARERITSKPEDFAQRAAEYSISSLVVEFGTKANLPENKIFELLSQAETNAAKMYQELLDRKPAPTSSTEDFELQQDARLLHQMEVERHTNNAEIFQSATQAISSESSK